MKISFSITIVALLTFAISCNDSGTVPDPSIIQQSGLGNMLLKFDSAPQEITTVIATLSRTGYSTRTLQMSIADSGASGSFEAVPVGSWHLRVNALDSAGVVRFSGETDVNVLAGSTSNVSLQLQPSSGRIVIVVTWGGTVQDPTLLLYYPFNGNTNDASGGGHHGVLHGATLTTDRFGHSNSAYMFDGVNDYVDVPNTNNWNFTGGFTLVAWVNFSQNIVDAIIVGKHNWGSYNGYALDVFSNRHCFYVSSDPRISASPQSNDGLWHMVAGVYNGQTQYLYLDGVLVNNRVVAYTNTNTTNVRIGAANIAGYFAGKIDDVRKYSRPLPSSEIQALYHEGGW